MKNTELPQTLDAIDSEAYAADEEERQEWLDTLDDYDLCAQAHLRAWPDGPFPDREESEEIGSLDLLLLKEAGGTLLVVYDVSGVVPQEVSEYDWPDEVYDGGVAV